MRFSLLATLCLLVACSSLKAQLPVTVNLSEQYGFVSKPVYDLYEAKDGMVWIATENGLFRFDGGTFKKFSHNGFVDAYSNVQEDRTGRIWCQNFRGQFFYIENDSVVLFADLSGGLFKSPEFSLTRFPGVDFFLGSSHIQIDFFTRKRVLVTEGVPVDKVDEESDRTVLYSNSQITSTESDGSESNYKMDSIIVKSSRKFLQLFCGDRNEILAFSQKASGAGNLQKFTNGKLQWKREPEFLNGVFLNAMLYDKSTKRYWLGTTNGLVIVDENFNPIFSKETLLQGHSISDIIQDREGNYWVSTLNDDIYLIPSPEVHLYATNPSEKITSFATADSAGLFMLSVTGKLYSWRPKKPLSMVGDYEVSGEFIHYDPYLNCITSASALQFSLQGERMEYLWPNNPDKPYIQLDSFHIIQKNLNNTQLRSLRSNKSPINQALCGWQASFELSYLNSTDSSLVSVMLRNIGARSLLNGVYSGSFYASYIDSTFYYNNQHAYPVTCKGSVLSNVLLHKTSTGTIFALNEQGDLFEIIQEQATKVGHFRANAAKLISCKEMLFCTSDEGVTRFDRSTKKISLMNRLDGLPSNGILDIAASNDTLFIASVKGLVRYHYLTESINNCPPILNVQQVIIAGNEKELSIQYHLQAHENRLEIHFQSMAVRSQGTFQYAYRMLGIDSVWTYTTGSENVARFQAIRPGRYTFEVFALNEDGVASETTKKIDFTIESYYYQKWWFFLLIALFFTGLLSTTFLLRIRAIRRRNKIVAEKEKAETQLSQSQLETFRARMNPHFIFNTLNSIQEYILSNQKELAGEYLSLFATLMRKYLRHSQMELIALEAEIEALEIYLQLEFIRFDNVLNYKIEVSPAINEESMMIPSLLIQPFVENALKHGLLHRKSNRLLTVSFEGKEEGFRCEIEDNGVGRKAARKINMMRHKEHQSYATSAIAQRIELLNNKGENKISVETVDLYDENEQATGTKVIIDIAVF